MTEQEEHARQGNQAQQAQQDDQAEQDDQAQQAEQKAKAKDEAKEKIKELEQDPPQSLEDWPEDDAKYETFGGPEGEHSYAEGPETKLGPPDVRHHEGGKVTVEGEEVDEPAEFKGEPIPGGPTDPDAPDAPGETSD